MYVFAHFCPSPSSRVSVCESVCVCTCKKMNEGEAPGVMPLFCPYSKWKLCLLMEKGLVQRWTQSFQSRTECIPGMSAIIQSLGGKKKRGVSRIKKKKKMKTERPKEKGLLFKMPDTTLKISNQFPVFPFAWYIDTGKVTRSRAAQNATIPVFTCIDT